MIAALQHIARILSPAEKRQMIFLLAADFFIQLLDLAAMALLLFTLRMYIQPATAVTSAWIPAFFQPFDRVRVLGIILLVFLLKNLLAVFIQQSQYQWSYRIASRLSEDALAAFYKTEYAGFVKEDSASNMRAISQQPIEFAQYVLTGVQQVLVQSALVSLTVIALLSWDIRLCGWLALVLLPPVAVAALLLRRATRQLRHGIRRDSAESLQYLREALDGYVEAHTYGKINFFLHRYGARQKSLNRGLARLQGIQGLPNRGIEFFMVIGLVVVLMLSGWQGGEGLVTMGVFFAAAYKVMPGCVKILNHVMLIRVYQPMLKVLPGYAKIGFTKKDTMPAIAHIRFEGIHFRYADNQPILYDFSATFLPGRLTVIHARSGSGKTTLINILLGLLLPDSGTIFVNHLPVTNTQLREYQDAMAYVRQQPFLLHDTLQRNILLDEAAPDMVKLRKVISITGLDTWVSAQQDGLQTIISEQGKNISGGQMQRIGIARAFYKDAPVLVLDEPFNGLDQASLSDLLQLMQQLKALHKIVILVSHNPRCLSIGDDVIDLNESETACHSNVNAGLSG
jgi:ABC-type bacteriocin/lantibiotic exporter with double-glycine peptidase domain